MLKKAAYLNAFLSFFWTSIPFCVALASFATYVLTDPNNVLTAEKGWFILGASIMAIRVVEFSNGEYNIRKIFA